MADALEPHRPDYLRVYDALHRRLTDREWQIGQKIPSINALQAEYGVNYLNGVRRAEQMLVEQGYLRTEQGRGAFVVAHPTSLPEEERTAVAVAAIDEAMRLLVRARQALGLDEDAERQH